ncbi:hypothetical protein JKP88DRAFT_241480 [Tribonema minus]|uniref:Uncharacterized protein n=1 Tax=Tribonema minus TaxID=303371 RepID=A0A836CDK3_9STRA|nr:hypothetical protein JKP88DRAFT_241480 [Tribonema minus]
MAPYSRSPLPRRHCSGGSGSNSAGMGGGMKRTLGMVRSSAISNLSSLWSDDSCGSSSSSAHSGIPPRSRKPKRRATVRFRSMPEGGNTGSKCSGSSQPGLDIDRLCERKEVHGPCSPSFEFNLDVSCCSSYNSETDALSSEDSESSLSYSTEAPPYAFAYAPASDRLCVRASSPGSAPKSFRRESGSPRGPPEDGMVAQLCDLLASC